jgi:DNA-binding beta-propeller fold protein YncE
VMTPFPNDYGIPASIAVSSDGKTLYGTSIATGSPHIGYIYKIDVDTGTVLATAAVGRVAAWRWDLVISPNGDRIYAEGQLEGGGRQVVRAIDAETLEVVSEVVTTGHQHEGHLAISSDGSRIYTLGYAPGDASGSRIVLSIIEVSGDTLTLAATRTLGPWHARALAGINVSPDDSRVYVFTQSEDSPRASDLYVLDSRDAHTIHHGTLSVGAISWAVGQTVLSDAGRFLHVRVQLHTDDDVAAAQVITFDTTKLRDAGGGGTTDDTQGALRASINMSVGWIPVVGTVFNAFNLVSDFFAFTIALIQGNTADMTRVINSMALDLVGLIPIIGGPLAATLYWNSLPAGSAPTTTATDTNL